MFHLLPSTLTEAGGHHGYVAVVGVIRIRGWGWALGRARPEWPTNGRTETQKTQLIDQTIDNFLRILSKTVFTFWHFIAFIFSPHQTYFVYIQPHSFTADMTYCNTNLRPQGGSREQRSCSSSPSFRERFTFMAKYIYFFLLQQKCWRQLTLEWRSEWQVSEQEAGLPASPATPELCPEELVLLKYTRRTFKTFRAMLISVVLFGCDPVKCNDK